MTFLFILTVTLALAVANGYVIKQDSNKVDNEAELDFPWEQVIQIQKGARTADANVCYNDNLGCFSNSAPFNNAGGSLPVDPAKLKTEFLLFTPKGQENFELIKYGNLDSISKSSFDSKLPTKVIIHGFNNDKSSPWITEFRHALMDHDPSNIIVVDWGHGAAGLDYAGATANTRLVGKQTCLLMNDIMSVHFNSDWRKTHTYCIGHSLGAHACGYTSNNCNSQFDRITGIDPAGPLFEGSDPLVRLDAADARFVDIIHGNAGSVLSASLGIVAPSGHVDFFPNGGSHQPGCPSAISSPSCSHNRVRELYLESLKSHCPFTAFKCASYNAYDQGNCMSCVNDGCSEMGYYADQWRGRGNMYLLTSANAPYCGYNYVVEVKMAANAPHTAGDIALVLDTNDTNGAKTLFGKDTDMKANQVIHKVLASDRDFLHAAPIQATFHKKSKPLIGADYNVKMVMEKFKILNVGVNETYNSCGQSVELTNNESTNIVIQTSC